MRNLIPSTSKLMEKRGQELSQPQHHHQQQPQQALKCPRCDSSNTKFCYYNNYSLSQPRHFCKACKRYWTRGGTLRNVPVGGGCRKNKRVKRPTTAVEGFSSGIMTSEANVFNPAKQIQDVVTSSSLPPNYSIFGSSSSTTTSPTMATLLASSLHQQKFSIKDIRAPNHFQTLTPFEDLQMSGNFESGIAMKEVKIEQDKSRLDWNIPCQNQIEQIGFSSSDPSIYWNAATSTVGAWHDPSNIGSPSLL
ncbi:hypothetical protein GH714_002492 [Hevea brasiliensis]|uniref:Dof zinc finger protein n=1 Tax=Hevea brasiliensis TaxID=3981 RepID=A0A6A6LCJ2_HEVBR|nr:hypothetical protein GH714_002492 [Hevea brasiliensis]